MAISSDVSQGLLFPYEKLPRSRLSLRLSTGRNNFFTGPSYLAQLWVRGRGAQVGVLVALGMVLPGQPVRWIDTAGKSGK